MTLFDTIFMGLFIITNNKFIVLIFRILDRVLNGYFKNYTELHQLKYKIISNRIHFSLKFDFINYDY